MTKKTLLRRILAANTKQKAAVNLATKTYLDALIGKQARAIVQGVPAVGVPDASVTGTVLRAFMQLGRDSIYVETVEQIRPYIELDVATSTSERACAVGDNRILFDFEVID